MNHSVELVFAPSNAEEMIVKMARVSNPKNADNMQTAPKLLGYLIKHRHWSPFEMAHVIFSIKTSRSISRQLLRHRSFSFQEFSQRYAEYDVIEGFTLGVSDARKQDQKNRQNSLDLDLNNIDDLALNFWWKSEQQKLLESAQALYKEAVGKGVAKEVARNILPEGLTPTHLYMAGNLRSWLHFCQLRCKNGTQKETTAIANDIKHELNLLYPSVMAAAEETLYGS